MVRPNASVLVCQTDVYIRRFYKMISALRRRFASDEQEKLLRTDENGHDREENGHAVGDGVGHAEQNGHTGNNVAVGYGTN
jgi:hypothetical protein